MDGTAIVYCDGAFGTPNGKTANGLVRYTARYQVLGVIDSTLAGRDAGEILDGAKVNIPIFASLSEALASLASRPDFFVIGLAPDGGQLPSTARAAVGAAIAAGLHVDSGLHQFLGDDPEFAALAAAHQVRIRDVRRPPDRSQLHFFSGKIDQVKAPRLAVLGTDSAIGKRTTTVRLNQALNAAGIRSEMIGTGQTSWLQGVRYGLLLDSLINDFVTGEIEHAIYQAWINEHPAVILLEGQGSLAHPAYPGGFELIGAGRVDGVILQHAPSRRVYDGFDNYPMGSLDREIQLIELLAQRPVIALTINHENMTREEVESTVAAYEQRYQRPTVDVLWHGCDKLVAAVRGVL
ncbi:MAG: DUF1611 domain-containing protein [Acidobacteriota bacterium]|jgi:uncharacterized NAD-dependent epimerase/dehydratase family protein